MKISIIGFGNLGSSLTEGLLKSGSAAGNELCICEKSDEVRERAATKFGVNVTADVNEALRHADVIFLVVKGYAFEDIAPLMDRSLFAGKTFVSFMAGVTFEKIFSLIGEVDLVRGMPSLAIAVCDGVIGYTKAPKAVADIFHRLGYAFEVAAEDIEKVMAYSSCGLGFAAYLLDAYMAAGTQMGFSEEDCLRITAQTFKNAIDRSNYGATVKAVATKGGATEQGVLHMDACKVSEAVAGAVLKAYDRMK